VRPRAVVRELERDGWEIRSQHGSHLKMRKHGRRPVIIPMHNRDVPPGTLRAILREADVSAERFVELLRA
jgi:predicted RNA binding protein YcfA (HicA-like mRNA interferase family)